jgi:hypothetical protein
MQWSNNIFLNFIFKYMQNEEQNLQMMVVVFVVAIWASRAKLACDSTQMFM